MIIAAGIIFAFFAIVFATASFWVNWWWFGSIGYRSVLVTRYSAQIIAFLLFGVLAAGFFFANLVFALRRTRRTRAVGVPAPLGERLVFWLLIAASALVFLTAGSAGAARWDQWLLWRNGESFGLTDPIFGRDVGFYVFTLPALTAIRNGLSSLLIATAIGVAIVYALRLGVNPSNYRRIPDVMRVHVLALLGLLLLTFGAGYLLANYELVFSTRGVVFGASYTDVNAQRWANYVLAGITVAAAAILMLNAYVRRLRWLLAALIAWGALGIILGVFYPAAVQRTVVEPSELRRERTYIEDNIAMTRAAYALDAVESRALTGQGELLAADVTAQPTTVQNVRLWDYRVIGPTFQQLQAFAPYYAFRDVDVDRYLVDGEIQQVLLASRELNIAGLPDNAQTWSNRHLAYTHGYGVVVSPVNEVTRQGLPAFLVERIPPTGTGDLAVTRPEIYFGESAEEWIIVGTEQEEFTGLADQSIGAGPTRYDGAGRGAIGLGSFGTRLVAATYLRDRNVLLSGSLTEDSELLLRREIGERVRTIAPFLTYDPDPYMVIANGRLVWIIDAYTSTDRFPDATPTRGINYVRNSVKVVIDAYDGTTTFYRTATPDPIADAYAEIYPDLLTPISEVDPAIAAHFRYPELLFNIQTEIYASYHVTDPQAFYNGDDRWAVAQERVGETTSRMEPYYVTLALPDEAESDFTLILPFTPGGRQTRQNMTAWMAARTDTSGNLRVVSYSFPRQVTVFGPEQIAARIDQEPDISSQISLWDQSGSQVIRGNMLVIPFGESLLYIQPLYLRATGNQVGLPELKRVIAATSDRVVMRPTLEEALVAVTSGTADVAGPLEPADTTAPVPEDANAGDPGPITGSDLELARQALAAYERGQTALAAGDWNTYGREQATVQALLARLAGTRTADPAAVASPTP